MINRLNIRPMLAPLVAALVMMAVGMVAYAPPALAHDCDYGHSLPDTPARAAQDLNGDGDMTDTGEAAVAAKNGACFSQTTITDYYEEVIALIAVGLGVFIFIKGWRLVVMAITTGIAKAFATIGGIFRRS